MGRWSWVHNNLRTDSRGLIQCIIWVFEWGNWRTSRCTSVRIAGSLTNLWTRYLPNTSLEHYWYTNLFRILGFITKERDTLNCIRCNKMLKLTVWHDYFLPHPSHSELGILKYLLQFFLNEWIWILKRGKT